MSAVATPMFFPTRVMALVDGDVAVARRLLRRFVDDVPPAWKAIELAVAGGRADAIAAAVHYLKGSLSLVDADALATQLAAWERDASPRGPGITRPQLQAARDALAELLRSVREYLDRSPPTGASGSVPS